MKKQKIGVVAVGIICMVALVVGGFLMGLGHLAASQKKNLNVAATDYSSISGNSGTPNSVPLNQAPTTDSNTGGLSVSSSTASSSLGQLGSTNGQSGGTSSSSGGNSQSSSSATPAIDPSTFAQYDKYKSGNQAMFGEVQKGTGDTLVANKKAAVYYKGWLTNGQLFDESRTGSDGKLQPFVFTLGARQVITGWEEGLAGMKVGGTRLLIVPPSVGYGAQGQGSIPPNSLLVFEVQLLAVQ